MKKSLMLVGAYILMMILGCVLGIFIYMQFYNTMNLIAGKPLHLFSASAAVSGFFTIIPVVFLLSGFVLTIYRIRHEGGFLPDIVYMILCAATWCVLYPLFLTVKEPAAVVSSETPGSELTSGYFRNAGESRIYLLDKKASDTSDSVIIDTDAREPAAAVHEGKKQRTVLAEESEPFKDVLIKDTLPAIPAWLTSAFIRLEVKAVKAWKGGWFSWLCFMSFGLALCSVYMLRRCSQWRLINTLYLILAESAVLAVNTLYFLPSLGKIHKWGASFGGLFKKMDDPVLVAANCIITVIFAVTGLVAAVSRERKYGRK